MRKLFLLIGVILVSNSLFGQDKHVDSLKKRLAIAKNDSDKVRLYEDICNYYSTRYFDSLLAYSKKGQARARQNNMPRAEIQIMCHEALGLQLRGDMPQSLTLLFKALPIAKEKHLIAETMLCLDHIGDAYWFLNDFPKAITFYKQAIALIGTANNSKDAQLTYLGGVLNISLSYLSLNRLDSAKSYVERFPATAVNDEQYSYFLALRGQIGFKMGDRKTGLADVKQSLWLCEKNHDDYNKSEVCYDLALDFKEIAQRDSAIFYAKEGLTASEHIDYKTAKLKNSKLLVELFENNVDQAYHYLKLSDSVNEEMFGSKKVKELQRTLSDEQQRQLKIEAQRAAYQNQLKEYAFLAGLAVMLLIAAILYRNNRREKKDKKLLQEKNGVIEKTLTDLKATQTSLIQSEKMASLGELTAGIAHEIQNPLNFVNNFSDVNQEMLDELAEELNKGNIEEAIAIAVDVKQNELKISHHGKRADSIVKGMLEHSRSASGQKEPTDINQFADEYMRLAYHGLRAKDKSFNAELKTHFDKNLPQVNVIPQDIGRVMLNLFNNAFYAVNQKQKNTGEEYKPEVSVTTSLENGLVIIKVKDNGVGMPDTIKEKIMQPFFTTKPPGEGTGLGLSLTYDMVVKGHGGTIEVTSKDGEGTEFIIHLPAN